MKKLIFVLLTAVAIAFGVVFLFKGFTCNQKKQIEKLEETIAFLKKENIPIRFKKLEQKDGYIQVAVKFYDADGKTIKKIERKLIGDELQFDFFVAYINGQYVAFPSKLFTDKIAPSDGESLVDHYDIKGFPQIFYFKGIKDDLKEGLKDLFTRFKNNEIDESDLYFGSMVHDLAGLKSFDVGETFRIVTRTKGGIEVIIE